MWGGILRPHVHTWWKNCHWGIHCCNTHVWLILQSSWQQPRRTSNTFSKGFLLFCQLAPLSRGAVFHIPDDYHYWLHRWQSGRNIGSNQQGPSWSEAHVWGDARDLHHSTQQCSLWAHFHLCAQDLHQRTSLGQDTVEALLVLKAQPDKPHTVQQLQHLKSAYAKHQKQYKHWSERWGVWDGESGEGERRITGGGEEGQGRGRRGSGHSLKG